MDARFSLPLFGNVGNNYLQLRKEEGRRPAFQLLVPTQLVVPAVAQPISSHKMDMQLQSHVLSAGACRLQPDATRLGLAYTDSGARSV